MAEENGNLQVLAHKIIQIPDLAAELRQFLASDPPELVAVGGGTGSKPVVELMGSRFPDAAALVVPEHHSTERARERYWKENPSRGWRRFVPRSMLTPPEPYDDWAAVLLAEDILKEIASQEVLP